MSHSSPQGPIELLQMRAAATPRAKACAVRVRPGKWKLWTWSELWEEVQQMARTLRGLGLSPGDHLAILAKTGVEWFVCEYAGMQLGAVVVGIDRHAGPAAIAHILSSTRLKLLIVDECARDLSNDDLAGAERMVRLQEFSFGEKHRASSYGSPSVETGDEFPQIDCAQAATLIYTSGTTGTPKAIEYSHQQLMAASEAICAAYPELKPGDRTLCWLPMAHLFQRMMNLVAIARAATIYFADDPRNVVACAAEVHPTIFVGVPRFFEKLRAGIERKVLELPAWKRRLVEVAFDSASQHQKVCRTGRGLSWNARLKYFVLDRLVLSRIRRVMGTRLRFMVTGSAPIAECHLEFFSSLGWPVLEAYGISENTVPIAANLLNQCRFGSVGVPFPQNSIRFGPDDEILVKGLGVFSGYWREESNEDLFTADGFYNTGDIGRLDEDGFLHLIGRKSEMFKTSTGRKVFPSAIESVYQEDPLIDRIVVFGEGRPYLVGLVTLSANEVCRRLGASDGTVTLGTLIQDRRVVEMARVAIEKQGEKLANHQRIVLYSLLAEPFEVATGELTTNLKIRRHVIATKFAQTIDQLYDGSTSGSFEDGYDPVNACLISS